jgi:hypothetical protein
MMEQTEMSVVKATMGYAPMIVSYLSGTICNRHIFAS